MLSMYIYIYPKLIPTSWVDEWMTIQQISWQMYRKSQIKASFCESAVLDII